MVILIWAKFDDDVFHGIFWDTHDVFPMAKGGFFDHPEAETTQKMLGPGCSVGECFFYSIYI